MDAFVEFQKLPVPASGGELSAHRLSAARSDYLAKSSDGAPHFLLHDAGPAAYTPGIQLRNVSVQFHTTCRVQTTSGSIEGTFVVVACDATTPELHELFVRCVAPAVEQLPAGASTAEISHRIQSLLELFRAMSRPQGREVAGLWAELFCIARSTDIAASTEAWHANHFERFDFSTPTLVLEVKATQGELRVHDFALEQLAAPTGQGLVASLLLQPLTGGMGIMDLAAQIDSALSGHANLRSRLWANIAEALGADFGEKLDRRFDASYAERALVVFSMADIPAPPRPSDARISNLRFRVDLTTVASTFAGSTKSVFRPSHAVA